MVTKILIIILTWLVVVNSFALVSLNRLNLLPDTSYSWINPKEFRPLQGWNLIDLHSRWDSIWYLDIAKNGYIFAGEEKLSNIVFFPLYPALIKAGSFVTLGNYELAGIFISIICLTFASLFLCKLVKQFHPQINPFLPIMLLLIFPTSFFLNSIYSESLFLFLSIGCFYYTLKKNYLIAALFGLFASLTKLTGVILFIPVIFEYLEAQNFSFKIRPKILYSLLIPSGTAAFLLFHYFAYGDFLLFLKVESWWGRSFALNTNHFQFITNPAIINFMLDVFYILLFSIITFFVFKKLKVSYALYMIGSILIPLSTGTFMSIGRYILPLFPLYILLASIKNECLKFIINLLFILLLALNIVLFVNNYWAG
ncbi:MAG: mannosyltransferase family protein [Candidatus Daviesbacteria bacterium]|nr:mannosyltransferase family protein [Candidatus Daviesbacteria bacterium]